MHIRSSRRGFLQQSTALAIGCLAPRLKRQIPQGVPPDTPKQRNGDPDLPTLAAVAVDAAQHAGAAYADARLTLTRVQQADREDEAHGFGVRVLVRGYWGFLASSVWTIDEAARLARGAVAQAMAYGQGQTRPVDLGPLPAVPRGTWVMPVTYDPFDIPLTEKLDVMAAFHASAADAWEGIGTAADMAFLRQQKVFASSDGAAWAQTTYLSSAKFGVYYPGSYAAGLNAGAASADFLSPAGRGWEHVSESGLLEAIPQLIDAAEQSRHRTPVELGRYDVVCSADAMATLLDETLGPATELDRALGDEANASGTSYLDDPLAMLGTQRVSVPLVTITANRSRLGGAATVRWDDEGVTPEEFTVVKDGVLVDYQTTREQAAWLAPYYQRIGKPIRSHGCASASSALALPLQHAPNLALEPAKTAASFEDLVADTKKGIAILGLTVNMDQQQLNGMGVGPMREIVNGKLGRFLDWGSLQFRAPELWNNIVALGGPGTQRWYGCDRTKGQPRQRTTHSIGAVPAKIMQCSIIDATRRA